jgi:hypothetical protein
MKSKRVVLLEKGTVSKNSGFLRQAPLDKRTIWSKQYNGKPSLYYSCPVWHIRLDALIQSNPCIPPLSAGGFSMADASGKSRVSWLMPVVSVLVGLVGGALGYSAQHISAVWQEEQKHLLDFRMQTYADFFDGQSKLQEYNQRLEQGLKDQQTEALLEEYKLLTKRARFRIAVFSSKPLVETLAHFYEKYFPTALCPDYQKCIDDVAIYQQMRAELIGTARRHRVDDRTLLLLVFNTRLDR